MFPPHWRGSYFHLGHRSPLVVSEDSITAKGRCVENVGSRYIMEEEEEGGEKCWRCMNIYRKHENVLQYKESELFSGFLNSLLTHVSHCFRLLRDIFGRFRQPLSGNRWRLPDVFHVSKGSQGGEVSSEGSSQFHLQQGWFWVIVQLSPELPRLLH